jgi:hypothetical protein
MLPSDLKQRIFDDLFNALALLAMLDNEEIEEVAVAIANPKNLDRQSEAMFLLAATVVRMAKE